MELASAFEGHNNINNVPVGDVHFYPQPAGALAKVWKAAIPWVGQRGQNYPPAHVERRQDGPARTHTPSNFRGALHRQD